MNIYKKLEIVVCFSNRYVIIGSYYAKLVIKKLNIEKLYIKYKQNISPIDSN